MLPFQDMIPALFCRLFDNYTAIERLYRSVIVMVHRVGEFFQLRFWKRHRLLQDNPGHTLGAEWCGQRTSSIVTLSGERWALSVVSMLIGD